MIRGETPLNPYKTDSGAVGQRFESSRAHQLNHIESIDCERRPKTARRSFWLGGPRESEGAIVPGIGLPPGKV